MQRQSINWLAMFIGLFALVVFPIGCTTVGTSGAMAESGNTRIERLLIAAGFKSFPESSRLCQKVCPGMPPNKVVLEEMAGKKAYGYYSPESQRLYVGTPAQYQNFINLAVQQNLERQHYAPWGTPITNPDFWKEWQKWESVH
ncbi:MAG: hypothetical protein P8168_13690 [Deltaproteobacteria bacterium]